VGTCGMAFAPSSRAIIQVLLWLDVFDLCKRSATRRRGAALASEKRLPTGPRCQCEITHFTLKWCEFARSAWPPSALGVRVAHDHLC
jgi:hypothetical protein